MITATHPGSLSMDGWRDVLARAASRLPVAAPSTGNDSGQVGDSPEAIASRFGVELIPIPPDGGVPDGVSVISLTESGHPRLLERTENDGCAWHVRWAVAPVLSESSLKAVPLWLARQWLHAVANAVVGGAGAALVIAFSLGLLVRDENAYLTVALLLVVFVGAIAGGYSTQVARYRTDRWISALGWHVRASVLSLALRFPESETDRSIDLGVKPTLASEALAGAVRMVSQPLATLGSALIASLVIVAIVAPALLPLLIAMPLLAVALPAGVARWIVRSSVAADAASDRARDRLQRLLQCRAAEREDPADRESVVESIRDAAEATLAARTGARRAGLVVTVLAPVMPVLSILAILRIWPEQIPVDPGTATMVMVAIIGCGTASGLVMEAFVRALVIAPPAAAVRDLVRWAPPNGTSSLRIVPRGPITLVDVTVDTANGESSPLSITIATGDRIHLYHPDACLRTRVAETINGIRRPVSGRILHGAKDRTEFDPAWVRQHHAYISADLALPSGSVEMVIFGTTFANEERRRDVFGRVGLAEVLDRLPLGLSTPIAEDGTWLIPDTRLRLLLARALISDPSLTIIDGAIDLVSAGLRHEAGEILREWPGSLVITSSDPRPIVPGSRVWYLEK